MISRRDHEAFRLGVVEEQEKRVKNAARFADIIPGCPLCPNCVEFVK
jgi:hypothetical protein